ncbi:SDR family oxidoreductase [Bacteriovoracales bacterium]|nr:SDR family oxidoreductase [Bacteriovoracales bacterium]
MKAIVTGGAGFIGSHLIDHLLKENFKEIVVLDNMSTGRPENLGHLDKEAPVKICHVDISDERVKLETYFKNADYIFHLAALADIVPSIENPDTYYKSNVHGTFRVLQAAKKIKGLKKFVYSASSSCYGIPDHYPTKENSEIRPEYPYALTKRMGEELLLHWGKLYKLPVVSLRFFNVYGPRSRTSGTYGAVFGVFLAQKIAGTPFTVVGDGNQTRDFTYVTDIADALWSAAKASISNEVFNVGSGNHYSINHLVDLLGGKKTYIPKRPGEPDCTFADISKIKSLLGWKPQISLEIGVRKMLENIDYWKEAPIWTPESIAEETKSWFNALS